MSTKSWYIVFKGDIMKLIKLTLIAFLAFSISPSLANIDNIDTIYCGGDEDDQE
jgi:hypothetical protein